MDDITEILFVDPKPECACSHHDVAAAVAHELFLLFAPFAAVHAAVIFVGGNFHLFERAIHSIDVASGRAVNDARAAQADHQAAECTQPRISCAFDDFKAEIRAMRRRDNLERVTQSENPNQIFANTFRRRCCECHDRRTTVALQ